MKISPFSKTYEGRCVLDFSGIELQHGRIYAIVGANGSGKSTFAKILAGILQGSCARTRETGCSAVVQSDICPKKITPSV